MKDFLRRGAVAQHKLSASLPPIAAASLSLCLYPGTNVGFSANAQLTRGLEFILELSYNFEFEIKLAGSERAQTDHPEAPIEISMR